MKSSDPRPVSAIITSFIEAKHQLDLNVQESRLGKIKENKLSRQKRRNDALANDPLVNKYSKVKKDSKTATGAEKFRSMDEHKIKIEDLLNRLSASVEQGLSSKDVEDKRKIYGLNVLSEKKKTPWYVDFMKEMASFFALMLWAGGGFSFIAYGLGDTDPSMLYLGVILTATVLLIGTITFLQNRKSENVMEKFKNFIPVNANCLRNGGWGNVNASQLVPGDIIEVKAGNRIPADIRILSSNEMKVDNSSLTGESDALLRTPECTHPEHPLETKNLAFFGTSCKEGSATGIVINIGDSTVIGQIASLASSSRVEESTLTREINRFILGMCIISFSLGGLLFVLGYALGYTFVNNIVFAIGIIVANVPEGLLATLTVAIGMAAQRLAKAKVLVKNLDSVETLGCTTVICSDKTGTLTQNKMTVSNLWYNNDVKRAENIQKKPKDYTFAYDINDPAFQVLHYCAILSSDATFNNIIPEEKLKFLEDIPEKQREEKRRKVEEHYQAELKTKIWLDRPANGDASENALIKFFQPIQDILETRNKFPVVECSDGSKARMPFNSTNKFALTIVRYPTEDSHFCLYIKGAPEKIWEMSSHIECNGQTLEIDAAWKKQFDKINRYFGSQGERVLGFAKYPLPMAKFPLNFQFNTKSIDTFNFPLNRFSFCGLVSLIDPPRDVVPFSVTKCKSAGIKVVMVTGDQPVTAAAIARKVNIFDLDVKTVNEIAEEKGISIEKAMDMSEALVVHGDMITQAMNEDEELPERERGKRLQAWLTKQQIVFARTTPAQKLIIVQSCQRMDNVVAVTGDGVNDSPAIKKADIGIAMGVTGSDVAKDAADMVLLTDDFSALVIGVEEGRKVMDNLKKCLVYSLTSNIPEMVPYILMFAIGLPLPLSTILTLCIELGTDMFPGLSMAWEDGEIDLMLRKPRSRLDHLFNLQLLGTAYLENGILQSYGCMLTYFYVMNDFGIPILTTTFLHFKVALIPRKTDVYDPYLPNWGNSNVGDYCNNVTGSHYDIPSSQFNSVDWLYLQNYKDDLRHMYLRCDGYGSVITVKDFGDCRIHQRSSQSDLPVCYTTEALKYAQTGTFFAIVLTQYVNLTTIKTKKASIYFQGFRNYMVPIGLGSELCLTLIFAFFLPIQQAIGTRDVIWFHYGMQTAPFAIMQMIYDEIRKYLIRNAKPDIPGLPNWWTRNFYF